MAKIAGIKMCESYNLQYGTNYIAVMPTNLYGPNDNYNLETSHVLPALIRKIYLGKCLETDNRDAIKKDLTSRPIEGVDGNSENKNIISILEKYGIRRNHNGKCEIEIWGSGKPLREFLWSEEMADATVFVMENVDFKDTYNAQNEIRNTHINIGTGKEISIKDLTELIKKTIGFSGEFYFNTDKPDGTIRKLTDVSKIHQLGWSHKIDIEEGIKLIYSSYINT